jgi:hypothetical protein
MIRGKPDKCRSWRWRAAALVTSVLGLAGLAGVAPVPARASGSAVIIYNYFEGKCVDLPGNGTPKINDPVIQYDCNFDATW